nr:MYB transcription factor 11 [Cladosporium cladosporioides]
MGATSSQLLPSQELDTTHTPNDSQEELAALDGAMDDPAQRDDDVIHVKKKRTSTDASRSLKRSRKERASGDLESSQLEIADSQDAAGKAQQQATEELSQKPRKKKSKKDHAVEGDGLNMLATQDSMMSEQAPMSTVDSVDGSKRVKTKRKRATGRPSGLNIFPAGMSDPLTQESAIVSAERSLVVESPVVPEASPQIKQTKRLSGHLSPEMTNAQSSQQPLQQAKSPKVNKIKAKNGTSPVANKSPKISKKRVAEVQEEADMLPTPPEASRARKSKISKASKLPETHEEVDEGALRDDYSEVDATRQVEGWLSSQLDDDHSPPTPRLDPPASALRMKAAANASAKREKAQRSEEQMSAKKRRRSSQYREDDNDDYEPESEEQRDTVITETPGSTNRRSKKRTNEEIDDTALDVPTQDTASPLVSKKARRANHKTAKSAKRAALEEDQQDAAPSTPVVGPTKRKRKAKAIHDDDEDLSVGKTNNKIAVRDSERSRKGPLTAQEKTMVDNIFDETVKETGMTEDDLRSLIKTWRQATEFKEAVEKALPDRPLAAIRKFCQRRYHNMERGPWSPEDDTNLRNAYAAHPDKWTEISALVGRTGSDCKDRWKNTVSIQDTMQLGPWSQEETVALTKAVDQSIKELKKANKETKGLSRAELERMLSWAEVAKKLGGTRSAKRCNEKWQKIKRDQSAGRQSIPAQPLADGLDFATSSKKLRAIEKAYNQCDIGDLYDILTEIHTALPDPNQQFDHESTMWAIVAMKNPGSRFNSAMRRRGLHDAADVYKDEVAEHATISGRAKALVEYLEGQWGTAALAEKRAFTSLAAANKFKSAERVDSDEEDGSGVDEKPVDVDTETPPTSREDDEIASDQSSVAEVPDSQPLPAANNKRSSKDFGFSFKPINKKRKEAMSPQADADSDGVEQLSSSVKRKKSWMKAKMKA